MTPCQITNCPALAEPGLKVCAVHRTWRQSPNLVAPLICGRCERPILVDEWYHTVEGGLPLHGKKCKAPREAHSGSHIIANRTAGSRGRASGF